MKTRYSLGNWKMNHFKKDVLHFIDNFKPQSHCHVQIGIAPQLQHAHYFQNREIWLGAQNCSQYDSGAYTGEASACSLAAEGFHFCLIGHSERRQYFQETNEICLEKIKATQRAGLYSVYCIGESLEQYQAGQTQEILKEQIKSGLDGELDFTKLLIAYEPIWAIGTGKVPSLETIEQTLKFIQNCTEQDFQQQVPTLYGGSVSSQNIQSLSEIACLNGVLVGGASLKAEEFSSICSAL